MPSGMLRRLHTLSKAPYINARADAVAGLDTAQAVQCVVTNGAGARVRYRARDLRYDIARGFLAVVPARAAPAPLVIQDRR